MSNKKRILLVEDDTNLGNLLQDSLEIKNYEVVLKRNGEDAFNEFKVGKFDMCLLDVMMPKKDGFTLAKDIRRMNATVPITFLTAKALKEDTIEGLKLGADDYVPKPFSVRELVARVEAVLRRSQKLVHESKKITWSTLVIDPLNLNITIDQNTIELTKREVDILRYLIAQSNRPVSRQELLKEVWGYGNTQMDTRTVDIHITKLRRKLEDDPENPRWILTLRGEGYKIGS